MPPFTNRTALKRAISLHLAWINAKGTDPSHQAARAFDTANFALTQQDRNWLNAYRVAGANEKRALRKSLDKPTQGKLIL